MTTVAVGARLDILPDGDALSSCVRSDRRDRAIVTQRKVAFAAHDDVLVCPDGHRYTDVWVWEHGVIPCRQKSPDGGSICPWAAYLVGGGLSDMLGEPLVLVVYVTMQEALQMRGERMDLDRVMAFLGLRPEHKPRRVSA